MWTWWIESSECYLHFFWTACRAETASALHSVLNTNKKNWKKWERLHCEQIKAWQDTDYNCDDDYSVSNQHDATKNDDWL